MNEQFWNHVGLVIAVSLASFAVAPANSSAETVYQDDQISVDAGALARGVAGARLYSDATRTDYGFFLQNARLKLGAEYGEYTRLAVQYEAGGGSAGVLDAWGEVLALDPIFIRLGQFKMPVSKEALIGGGNLPFISRTLLNQFVPVRRVGADVYGVFDVGAVTIRPEVGLFQPSDGLFREPEGQLLMGRILVSTEFGLDVHAGYAGHVFEPNRLEADHPNNDSAGSTRVVPYDDPLDLAVTYKRDRLDLHLEGLTVLDPPTGESVFGGYLHGGYRFGPADGVQPKPMAAYDLVDTETLTQRVTAGLNVHWWTSPVYTTLNYRFQTTDADGLPDRHGIFVALTANI